MSDGEPFRVRLTTDVCTAELHGEPEDKHDGLPRLIHLPEVLKVECWFDESWVDLTHAHNVTKKQGGALWMCEGYMGDTSPLISREWAEEP
ncbi:MAG: hypothetical protein MK101_12195 [Phycisphaerales bacterium]|nr:hypothetical protein [Phycisphaerales bacterium]